MGYGKHDNLIGDWSLDKLVFLEKYLPAYAAVTKGAMHQYYIDGFAGRGEWIRKKTGEKVPGSAAIALQYASKFTHLYFVEMNGSRATDLRLMIKNFNAESNSTVLVGDCNSVLPPILKSIHPRAPAFVFLDPSSDQLKWRTIEAISQWKTELFILFPYHMTIQRYLPINGALTENSRLRLNDLFGTNEWESIYRSRPRIYLLSELLGLYTRRLQELGYQHVNVSKVFKVDDGPNLYYMIWVGKNEIGHKIMSGVFKGQSQQIELEF